MWNNLKTKFNSLSLSTKVTIVAVLIVLPLYIIYRRSF